MCVLWFNNYGLKIPFFSIKKIQKKKFWSWAHKITKISTFIPPPSYLLPEVPEASKFWQKFREINWSWIEIHSLTYNYMKFFFFFRLNFPWKFLSSAKYHPKKSLNNFFFNQKFFVKSKTSMWRIILEVCAFFLSVLVGTITSLTPPVKCVGQKFLDREIRGKNFRTNFGQVWKMFKKFS